MPAITYTVTDPVTGEVFKSRRKTRPYGAVIVDGINGPRVEAWAGRPDLLDAYHRRALNGRRPWSNPDPSARVAVATESHPAIRARLPRTLAGLSSHPWVQSIDDGRGTGDGIHVYLRHGFVWAGTSSAVIEPTVKACCEAFRAVAWDPEAWGQACGASAAEVAALTGEAAPVAPAAPAEAAPAPAAGRRLDPSAEMLLTRLQATDGQWLMVEVSPIVDTLRGLGWLQRSDVRGVIGPEGIPAVECRITAAGLAALTAEARPTLPGEATPPPASSHGDRAPSLPELRTDAAAGRPVSLLAVARAAQKDQATPAPAAPAEAAPVAPAAPAEAAPAPAAGRRLDPSAQILLARSIADTVAEASAALNAQGESATVRVFHRLGRIRAGLTALGQADAEMIAAEARPTLPGEATPPPAPSHGDRAPRLPELYPATPGTPARAEAVRDVERRDGGGVAVICSGSDREAFRLPDTVSHCGAAAALEAAGWILSPELEALAQRWRDLAGGEAPSPEAVAIAEAAAPQGRRFEVFHRTWWRAPGVPGVGDPHHIAWAQTEARARYLCRRWNASHDPGPLSDRAEYSAA